MPLIATAPIRIGNRIRQPGEELSAEDLKGRNVDAMKRHGHVAFVDEGKPASRSGRKPASRSDD